MTTDARTQAEALVSALEHRLAAISAQQHQLAVEKSRLVEQLTPLRLGVVAPDTAVVQLKAQGIMLRGLTTARATAQRPRRAMLKAVAPLRPVVPLAR
jgi:hypothetical protein